MENFVPTTTGEISKDNQNVTQRKRMDGKERIKFIKRRTDEWTDG